MKKVEPHIKARAIFLVLVLLSMVSTLYILTYVYEADLTLSDSFAMFQMADPVGIKEVGFVDFVVELFHRVIATLM